MSVETPDAEVDADAVSRRDAPTTRELLTEIAARDTDADVQLASRPVERRRSERRFVRWLLITIGALVIFLFAALWWLDPVSVTGRETRFSVVENGGVRQAKLDLMEALPAPPKVMVLGSSRSMKIDPKDITSITGGDSAFNGGVSGGTSKDIYLYARYADQLWGGEGGQFPHLVIGVINDVFRDAGTAGFDPRLRRFLPSADKERDPLEVTKALLQWKTLQSAARVTPKIVRRDGVDALLHPVQTKGALNADLAVEGTQQSNQKQNFTAEGFQLFDPVRSLKTPLAKRMDAQMRTYVANTYTNDPDYTGIDQTALVLMRRTIALANSRGDVPTIWITPYQPTAAEKYLPKEEYAARNKVFLDAMHKLHDDPSLDFNFVEKTSDIANYGGNPNHFYDGIHQFPSNTKLVMQYLNDQGLLKRRAPETTDKATAGK
jgi:hypothetical protein